MIWTSEQKKKGEPIGSPFSCVDQIFIYIVSMRKLRMRHFWFPIRKRGIFRPGKKIEELGEVIHWYAAHASPKIDAARAEKDRFRMENI
jgi:hypothetical protein